MPNIPDLISANASDIYASNIFLILARERTGFRIVKEFETKEAADAFIAGYEYAKRMGE